MFQPDSRADATSRRGSRGEEYVIDRRKREGEAVWSPHSCLGKI
jgi:hypothetical protein